MTDKKALSKVLSILLVLSLCFGLTACGSEKQASADDSDLTMFIGLGMTNTGYYAKLHELILEKTGIDVKFVYFTTNDTTNALSEMVSKGDVPADIIATAQALSPDIQQNALLDMAAYTNIPDLFSVSIQREVSVDGSIYQLPFCSRLIGIEYNKTLFEEMGWELPSNFEEMKALKDEADKAGYEFAISGGVATGHGMNYLLNVMGSQFLATPEGSAWLDEFQSGEAGIDAFQAQIGYFEKYVSAGLMGRMYTTDWNAKYSFMRERALFYYNITNDAVSYEGFRYNADGTLYGASYDSDGLPVVTPDPNGNAVFLNDEYVYYDSQNADHQGLERYTIPGTVVLDDEYGSMPWIGENSSTNCFVSYHNMYLALDGKLADTRYQDKLDKAITVLECIASDDATSLLTSILPDGYTSISGFNIDEDGMYNEYADIISKGYTMPWWYGYFTANSIVNIGQKVNEYIIGNSDTSMEDILDEMVLRNTEDMNNVVACVGNVAETLDYEDTSVLQAMSGARSLQRVLDDANTNQNVNVSIIPYMTKLGDLNTEKNIGIVQMKLYEGEVAESTLSMYVNAKSQKPVAVRLTGNEINDLVSAGYDVSNDYGLDKIFPYKVVTKGNIEIEAETEYTVAVSPSSVETELYNEWLNCGKVITDKDGNAYQGNTLDGMKMYFSELGEISIDNLSW